jgi:2',3'-cyclic-nucleotide 2'-phosphodiesterase (5'-nucleotidase family)
MFQGTALSNVFRGEPVIEIMNALNFDAMAIGNHEFDWGRSVLAHLQASAHFPFLSANVTDRKGQPLPGVEPYTLLERKGVKVAVIGITTPETAFTTKPDNVSGLTFLGPKNVLPRIITDVKAKGAKLIIVLSHLGLDADKKMAQDVGGIHVVVGGHSHTAVEDPVVIGRTIIVQAGCCGFYLGVLKIAFDSEQKRILSFTRQKALKNVSSGPEDPFDPEIARRVETYHQRIRDRFAVVVGETKVDLIRNSGRESNIGNLICDAMREAARAEIAFHNSGGIRANIPQGKITLEQVYALLPFDNLLISMDLTGRQILRILERNARGDYGILQVSGLRVVYDLNKRAGQRVIRAEVAGRPLAPERRYRMVTNDFLAAGGDAFSAFRVGKNIRYGDALRDVFVDYLKKHSPVRPEIEGRTTGLESDSDHTPR